MPARDTGIKATLTLDGKGWASTVAMAGKQIEGLARTTATAMAGIKLTPPRGLIPQKGGASSPLANFGQTGGEGMPAMYATTGGSRTAHYAAPARPATINPSYNGPPAPRFSAGGSQATGSGPMGPYQPGASSPWMPRPSSPWYPPGASSPWRPMGPLGAPGAGAAAVPSGMPANNRSIAVLTGQYQGATAAAGRFSSAVGGATKAMRGGRTASESFGQGLLQLGYTVDDSQYGMRGMMNNIAPLVMGLGLGAGVAGALQILGVVLQQGVKYWDEWSGATERAAAKSELAAQQQKYLARITAEAGERGSTAGAFLAGEPGRRTAGRASMDKLLAREGRLAEIEKEKANQRAEDQKAPAARLAAQLRNQQDLDRKMAALEVSTATDRYDRDMAKLAELNGDIAATEKELAPLQAKKKRWMDAGGEIGGMRSGDVARIEYLEKRLPGLTQARDEMSRMAGDSWQNREDATQFADKELQHRQDGERAALTKQTNALIEDENRERREMIARFDEWGEAMRASARTAREERAAREKDLAAQRGKTEEDGDVAHLRARGHQKQADRAQRRLTRRDREKALRDQGFKPEAAAEMARREESDARGKVGVRDARAPTTSGLDDFDFKPRGYAPGRSALDGSSRRLVNGKFVDVPLPPMKTPAQRDAERAQKKGKVDVGGAKANAVQDPVFASMLTNLQAILAEVRKTPAEKNAPLKRGQ